MKYSLLHKTEEKENTPCEILYDLSVDRAVYRIIKEKKHADYFLSVIGRPLSETENIRYRREILDDFDRCDGLLSELKTVFSRYDKIKSDWQEMKPGNSEANDAAINPELLLERTFSSLKVTAIFPSTIASFFSSIGDVLGRYGIRSEGLTSIRNQCTEMKNSDVLSELIEISQLFRYKMPKDFDFTVSAALDNALRVTECDLIRIEEHRDEKGFHLLRGRKNNDFTDVGCQNNDLGKNVPSGDPYSDAVTLLCNALCRIDTVLTEITSGIYESFFGISSELMFYESALTYIEYARTEGVPVTFPVILEPENDCMRLTGLRELMLLANGNGKNTVPNDISINGDRAGMLVKGMTDSGKTVYLRAIGCAQLFAQAGLPVLAENCELSIRRGFFSHFSSSEEAFLKCDDAGRFDGEAKEIAGIIDRIRPYSLLLLNETFQTTSYREGTEGIGRILKYMPRLKVKYVFVTHLTGLFDYLKDEKILFCHTSDSEHEKYKIITDK